MDHPDNDLSCPKCGNKMIEGRIIIPIERITAQTQAMPQYASGFMMGGQPGIEDFTAIPKWVEKTGEKTGIIFKRDNVIEMRLTGYRCTQCNYIELHAAQPSHV
jgi:predicted nucleic-acid-binding Zn-ribbon protein